MPSASYHRYTTKATPRRSATMAQCNASCIATADETAEGDEVGAGVGKGVEGVGFGVPRGVGKGVISDGTSLGTRLSEGAIEGISEGAIDPGSSVDGDIDGPGLSDGMFVVVGVAVVVMGAREVVGDAVVMFSIDGMELGTKLPVGATVSGPDGIAEGALEGSKVVGAAVTSKGSRRNVSS